MARPRVIARVNGHEITEMDVLRSALLEAASRGMDLDALVDAIYVNECETVEDFHAMVFASSALHLLIEDGSKS
jgi:hypothetical protein